MINFPTLCVDGFYNNPDAVRDFALSQEYFPSTGNWPGQRTKLLHYLNKEIFNKFCSSLFSIFYTNEQMQWSVDTCFWKVGTVDPDPFSPKNMGWIHEDEYLFAGVVYLTPDIDKTLGTTIYKRVNNNTSSNTFKLFYLTGDDKGFDKAMLDNNKQFEETARFDNVYNRLVCFDGTVPHSVSNYYMKDRVRLNQVFFVNKVNSSCPTPIQRIRNDNV